MQATAAVLDGPTDSEDFAADQPIAIEAIEVEAPGPGEVAVEVAAASICHTDVKIATGQIPEPFPMVLGHEGAGVVHAVGEGVTGVEVGDHVVLGRIACGRCSRCRRGYANICEERARASADGTLRSGAIRFSRDGDPLHHCHGVSSFTEHTVVDEEVAIPIDDALPLEQATLLGCGVFTGFGAVTNTADVEPGASVAIFGAGGVGLSAVQGAVVAGASEIVLVDLIAEKLETGAALGATATVDASEVDAVEAVRELTDGGADYAFDIVGSVQTVEQVMGAIGPMGTAVVVGGPPSGARPYELDIANLVYTEQSLLGSFNGSYDLPTAIPMLADLVQDGRLSLAEMITGTRPLGELNDAIADLESSTAIRQVILPG